ncbi:MAG TPA: PKD domain-containing protein [Candidatus Bathyarchaeia archaeon]|nr:PKD domain-containing protein [Candidatus Bathyarchaeia archaeon]
MKNNVFGIMLLIVVCFGMLTMTAKASANLSVTISPPSPVILVRSTSEVFTATVAGGTPPYQFSWTLYDNLKVPVASGTGNPWNCTVPKYAFVGIGNVTVYVTDSQGDIGFTVEPVLILALCVSVSPAPATLDVGESQAFSSFVLGGTSPYSYQWYFDGSLVSGANGASWTYTPSSSGSHAVYVNVKDAASNAATSNTVLVTVNAALSTCISPTSVTLDVGQSQKFTSSTLGGTSPFTYQWYLDNSAVSGATSSSWICSVLESSSHTVCVKVTDCASTPVTAPSRLV